MTDFLISNYFLSRIQKYCHTIITQRFYQQQEVTILVGFLIFACHLSCELKPHSFFFHSIGNFPLSKQDGKINFRDLQREVSRILITRILIISCSWDLFTSGFIIIFRVSLVEKFIFDMDSPVFPFFFFCVCVVCVFQRITGSLLLLFYNRTLVSKEIVENIGFHF